jgi:hypothetical protein
MQDMKEGATTYISAHESRNFFFFALILSDDAMALITSFPLLLGG